MPEANEWNRHYEIFFWSPRAPLDVKYEVEKASTKLLERDANQASRLVFKNWSQTPPNQYELQLRLEAALLKRNLYALQLDASAPREWTSEASFRRDADRAFAYWTRNLQMTPYPGSVPSSSPSLYHQFVKQTIERESELAKQKENPEPVAFLQRAVLNELRRGKCFRDGSHEGTTHIYFNGHRYVHDEEGLAPGTTTYDTDEEMLNMLRNYFDYEAGAETRPHKPTEANVWRYIQSRLQDEPL